MSELKTKLAELKKDDMPRPPVYEKCKQPCLACGKTFKAWDRLRNRMCVPCKDELS